ncbi:hypothetical protein JKP88DRAFT_248895 [Tribonema minus]|uniref:Uncharacterized protein n=1 Tax=Tribonema minus TaxID=303371 RepID=A0A836CAF9_9STRA|nr:hypothetical protein JKP88DRAFT_248895 [Tribonema minus]
MAGTCQCAAWSHKYGVLAVPLGLMMLLPIFDVASDFYVASFYSYKYARSSDGIPLWWLITAWSVVYTSSRSTVLFASLKPTPYWRNIILLVVPWGIGLLPGPAELRKPVRVPVPSPPSTPSPSTLLPGNPQSPAATEQPLAAKAESDSNEDPGALGLRFAREGDVAVPSPHSDTGSSTSSAVAESDSEGPEQDKGANGPPSLVPGRTYLVHHIECKGVDKFLRILKSNVTSRSIVDEKRTAQT